MSVTEPTLYCSFCGKAHYEVEQLIAGPGCFICDECVELCIDIVLKARAKAEVRRYPNGNVSTDAPAVCAEYTQTELAAWQSTGSRL